MNANDWYKPPRELTPEELFSPWLVSSVQEVTPDRVAAFLAASGKNYNGDVAELARTIQVAWHGHLLDWSVPKKNGAVLLDHLVAFVTKHEGAVKCFMALSPSAQPDCYLSRYGDSPVIVYGHRCLVLKGKQWTVKPGVDVTALKPVADFAIRKKYPDVADAYIKATSKLSDVRIVVAIDKDYYDKDIGIIERLGDGVRAVIISLGEHNAAQRQAVSDLGRYRETYICEEESLLPACIGKTRSVFVTDKKELMERLVSCGVKVVSVGQPCPGSILEVPNGKQNEITADAILGRFVRAERSAG